MDVTERQTRVLTAAIYNAAGASDAAKAASKIELYPSAGGRPEQRTTAPANLPSVKSVPFSSEPMLASAEQIFAEAARIREDNGWSPIQPSSGP